jgi:hypothetical protein
MMGMVGGWWEGEGEGVLYVERGTLELEEMACEFWKMLCSSRCAMYFFENWMMRIGTVIVKFISLFVKLLYTIFF